LDLFDKEISMRIIYQGFAASVAILALSTLAARAGWFDDELPPPNAKPLSTIVKTLEDKGYRIISEIEFEDGRWEVEAHQAGGKEIELHVDPLSGQIATK
jgi:hypothetical protein